MTPRTVLVPVDPRILSSYGPGGTATSIPRAQLRPLRDLAGGRATPDTAAALLALHEAVTAVGGDLRITDLYRSVDTQRDARAKYDRWVAAGKPSPGTAAFDPKTMKNAYVAIPGRSWHNAARAIDVHIDALRFPGVAADRQLDRLWDIATPLGWRPIIKAPTEGVSESWHFEHMGPWARVAARRSTEEAAIAAAQDIANGELPGEGLRLQGGLHRAGYDVGEIDGIVGQRTLSALATAGYRGSTDLATRIAFVDALPTPTSYRWPAVT